VAGEHTRRSKFTRSGHTGALSVPLSRGVLSPLPLLSLQLPFLGRDLLLLRTRSKATRFLISVLYLPNLCCQSRYLQGPAPATHYWQAWFMNIRKVFRASSVETCISLAVESFDVPPRSRDNLLYAVREGLCETDPRVKCCVCACNVVHL
jgi:hypothetical protein